MLHFASTAREYLTDFILRGEEKRIYLLENIMALRGTKSALGKGKSRRQDDVGVVNAKENVEEKEGECVFYVE